MTIQAFFPFGPDLGQSGKYKVHLLNRNSHGMQVDPWKYFASEFKFILRRRPWLCYSIMQHDRKEAFGYKM